MAAPQLAGAPTPPAAEMAAATKASSTELEPMAVGASAPDSSASLLDFFKHKVHILRDSTTMDFDAWVSLIIDAEETSTNDMQVIRLVYDSFLSEFPLCYGYWIKYASHMARVCTCKEVVEVYEQAVQAVTHSVDLWISYCSFAMLAYEDPADIRRLFERALSFVGKDYLCHRLWDKYIEFEYSKKQWTQLATIYIAILKFPTKKLHQYYESFKKLVILLEQEAIDYYKETSSEAILTCEVINTEESLGDISTEVTGLFDHQNGLLRPDAIKKYLSAGERFYKRSSKIDGEISCFEALIKRPYFHVKPLDNYQLENWHQYLDFVEKHGDFDWAVKLYERCLIPCANYSEFWIRYVEFVDAKGGREIANYALGRASSYFIKGVPNFRIYCAMFKEQIGDALGARSLFFEGDGDFSSDLSRNINRVANMEKRMGNTEAASKIYETAIENAVQKQNLEILPDLYSNFAQFKYAASGSICDVKEVFVKGIKQAPCKPMIKGLIQFMTTHGGPSEIAVLDSVIANSITPGSDVSTALSSEDREDISLLYLEFVDLYGSIQELRKAWARHSKLFPHKTRNLLQYRTSESRPHHENKRRRIETSVTGFHDSSVAEISKVEPSSKGSAGSHLKNDKEVELRVDDKDITDLGKEQIVVEEVQDLQTLGSSEVRPEVGDAAQECIDIAQTQDTCSDKSKIEDQIGTTVDQEKSQDLSSCEQNDQLTKSPQSANHKSPVATSNSCGSPSKAFAGSKENDSQESGKTVEVSTSVDPVTPGLKSNLLSQESLPKERSPSNPLQTLSDVEEKQQLKVQVQVEAGSEHDVSASSGYIEKSNGIAVPSHHGREVSEDHSHDHIQASEPQLPVHAQNSGSEVERMLNNQSVSSASPVVKQISQAQHQHQMAGAQIHQSNNFAWAGQAIQQHQQQLQGLTYAMPQNGTASSLAQHQFSSQPLQGHQQYFQSMQGYTSQMWQYYQQQLYYLQVQHNQQMQSLQQQNIPTGHLQQNYMQQVQQLNQQMVLWQQQLQLQQASQFQQQPDKQQNQHHPSSLEEQYMQQQQESQIDHQTQYLQQQQLYFQQQQQMYLMQQQQELYLQQQQQQQQLLQQQLMQQQQLLSRPQQQQDLGQQEQLFQQQQQQLLQQQQQQMLLFQQQQQQFLQQQMQKQTGPQELKAQNDIVHSQHPRNQQMEHGQEAEASQSEWSKGRNVEQSESSYPSTPQSQRSNQ